MPQKIKLLRAFNATALPPTLEEGELAINALNPGAPQMWTGVPTSVDPSGRIDLLDGTDPFGLFAPLVNPAGGQNNYLCINNPTFTSIMTGPRINGNGGAGNNILNINNTGDTLAVAGTTTLYGPLNCSWSLQVAPGAGAGTGSASIDGSFMVTGNLDSAIVCNGSTDTYVRGRFRVGNYGASGTPGAGSPQLPGGARVFVIDTGGSPNIFNLRAEFNVPVVLNAPVDPADYRRALTINGDVRIISPYQTITGGGGSMALDVTGSGFFSGAIWATGEIVAVANLNTRSNSYIAGSLQLGYLGTGYNQIIGQDQTTGFYYWSIDMVSIPAGNRFAINRHPGTNQGGSAWTDQPLTIDWATGDVSINTKLVLPADAATPPTPQEGMLWYNGTDLQFYRAGAWRVIQMV